jgi:hypothetical protein
MQRPTAQTAKALPLAERKARVAAVAKIATGKAKAGIALIDFREPTAAELAMGEKLAPMARRALERKARAA